MGNQDLFGVGGCEKVFQNNRKNRLLAQEAGLGADIVMESFQQ
jgi:hypothetical protein